MTCLSKPRRAYITRRRARAILAPGRRRDAVARRIAPVKDLVLFRHAKAMPPMPGQADHDRPLAARGRADAAAMARWMAEAGWRPDLVLCSDAARTRETLEILRTAIPIGRTAIETGLYLASTQDLRARIRRIDPAAQAAMIIGHNPGLEELARGLAGGALADAADEERFPTAAAAWFRGAAEGWHGWLASSPARIAFMTPARLDGAAPR
jgi:phosphohistidine phosphatase